MMTCVVLGEDWIPRIPIRSLLVMKSDQIRFDMCSTQGDD